MFDESATIKQADKMKKSIPTWVTIISGLLTLLGLFVGGSLYLSPGTFIPDIDFSSADIKYLSNMWAARQIAIAAVIGYSLVRQSLPMLKISLVAYCLMNLQDAIIGVTKPDNGLIIGASVVFGLSAFMIFTLIRNENKNE